MTDAEVDDLIRQACRMEIRRAVRSLLAGNDVGCFTTGQYVEARIQLQRKRSNGSHMWLVEGLNGKMSDGRTVAEFQLARFADDLVRQLRPDLWAAVEVVGR